MKTNDFLTNHMQIRRPKSALVKFWAAHGAQISNQRVKPHVKHMRGFARNWNAPSNCGACNGKISQSALYETQNLIASAFGAYEVRICGIEIEKFLLEFGKLEKIIFLGDCFRGAAAIGTRIARACIHDVSIVMNAILTGVMPLLNKSIF